MHRNYLNVPFSSSPVWQVRDARVCFDQGGVCTRQPCYKLAMPGSSFRADSYTVGNRQCDMNITTPFDTCMEEKKSVK